MSQQPADGASAAGPVPSQDSGPASSPEAPESSTSNWNVPNALTTLRIAMVPVFGWVLLHDGPQLWRQAAPRTNLRLTDAQGYDIPNDPDNLFRLVDSVSGWRHEVARALRAAGVS